MFGQAPAFGQPSAQTSAFPQQSAQASAFGQPSAQASPFPQQSAQATAFGQPSTQASAFGQPSAQASAFGQPSAQASAFGQPSTQASAFGQPSAQASAFAQPSAQASTFGQQSAQASAFGQPSAQASAFGQPSAQASAFGQPSAQASAFGQPSAQASAFGQPSAQASAFGQPSAQASAFGQPSSGVSSTGFGGGTTPAFGQTGGPGQSSMFGQTPAFGQASGFGKQPPAIGQQPSGFGSPLRPTVSQPQPLGFGQPSSSSTTATTNASLLGPGQSRSFAPSEFSFRPANEALFKPIFSASPEPTNPPTTSLSNSAFGGSQTTSSTTTTAGFSLLPKPGSLGFSFSEPASAPSISSQSNPLTTDSSSGPATTLQFTFSQPATLTSSSTKAATTEPTTPSSFSFTPKTLQPQASQLFGGTTFGQPSAFSETKTKEEASTDVKVHTAQGDINIFARLGKGTKRKDDPPISSTGLEKSAVPEEDVPPEAESPRHPPKRPLMRSHDPPRGLISRALSSLRKDGAKPVRRKAANEPEREDVQIQSGDLFVTPPAAQTLTKDVQDKAEESAKPSESKVATTTPNKRGSRTESMDSLSGMSPTDCTSLMCRNVPSSLNRRDTIEKHFARFGKVHKIICRPAKNLTIVYFNDHASAAKAKKKGKMLQGKELLLLWQRKKQSKCKHFFKSYSPVKKPSPVKALQFDTEPQKESSTSQSSERPVPSSLLPLIGQVAETAEDKYRLLEQRDKILRQGRPKRTDLHLSKVFVGTCPDMCPEKERYMRETRNQLSAFEVIPSTETVDHKAAIKEYSRSSADQEEPLPHELRPLPVLSMTMDYLVTQIMDLGHDNYRDWYDFVWNRTRGIRKDIIQQHLCCPQTVSLIEKCTRFHVHCAHHLCEEHMSTFDPKINNENMTKCLQSLKEMYQDLATRHIFCPREPEFRQYSVLLKLNDGDILRSVQQFRDEVRNSTEVKFAVQAFAAVNSNNFVRFFKLVKGASYLASCLLHRYFNQVRAKALKTLNMAHTVGPRSTLFPVNDVVRMLMFRTTAEATDFVQQYGLNVNDGMVELSRIAYQEPELPLSQKKSEVILAKRTVLIGEVVNGGPLPNPPQHTPVCSFDSQNKYRGEGGLIEATPSQRRQEHEAFLTQFSFSLCTEVMHEVLDETIKETALNEKAERVAKCTEQVCVSLVEETLNADIAVLVENLLEAELQRIHKYIKRWRDVVAVRRQLKRQMRGFPAAPCCVDPRFKLKALAPSAPAQPSIADLARGLVNLGNAGMLALSSTRCVYLLRGAIHQMRVHYYFQQLLDETVWAPLDLPALVTESIPNAPERIFWKAVVLLPSNHESVASVADRILSDWLEVKLGGHKESEGREEQPEGTLQTLTVTNTLQESGQRTHKVHISIKVRSHGLSKMEESCELQGTSALIMLLPALPTVEPDQDEQDVPLLSALLQLKQLQQASAWHCPLPLVILVPGLDGGAADTQKLVEALKLHTLVTDGLISEYTFFFIPETTNDLQGSKQAVRWLALRTLPPFSLTCKTLVELIESTLSHEFSPRVYSHRLERATAHLPSQDPAPVVQLYNAVLTHVADKVASQELCGLSWPPGEFCLPDMRDFVPHLAWNSYQHLAWLREIILSLQLPEWEQLSATDSWSELCSSIFRYAAKIPVSRRNQPLLMSRLENLLERVKLKSRRTRTPGYAGEDDVCVDFSLIPWDDVLVICIDHKLKDWQIPKPPVCQDAVTEDGEILVYFPKYSLKGFQPPEEWTEAMRQTHREKQQEKEG
uniref:Germinal-center associated nuclear protein n=1 Tax=Astatotilapia calliptera TaxID=8154 RepID=A0A3P8NGE7_ASTCA